MVCSDQKWVLNKKIKVGHVILIYSPIENAEIMAAT